MASITRATGQANGASTGSGTSITKAFTNNIVAPNLIAVGASKFATTQDDFVVGDVTKSAGTGTVGTVAMDVQATRSVSGGFIHSGVYSVPVTGGGTCTMSLAGAPAASALNIAIQEYVNADVSATRVDGTSTGTGASGNAATGSVTSSAGAVFVGGVTESSGGAVTHTEDAGYALIYEQDDAANFVGCNFADQIVTVSTADTYGCALSTNTGWIAVLAVYKEAAAGGAAIGNVRPASRNAGPAVQRFNFRTPPYLDQTVAAPTASAVLLPAAGTRLVGPPALRQILRRPNPGLSADPMPPAAFDPALMAAMSWPWPVIVFSQPQAVASGMTPPDNIPN